MKNIQQITNAGEFIVFLNEMENSLLSNKKSFSDFCDHLLHSEKDKNLIKKYILEVVQKWKSIEELGNLGLDNFIIQDVFIICELAYKNDSDIARIAKEVILNENSLDMENVCEVDKFVTLARSYTMAYEVFSEEELIKLSSLIKDEYPWLWVDVLFLHNWPMVVDFVKELRKTNKIESLHKIDHRIWLAADRLTKEQLQYAFDEWEDFLNKQQKDYFIRILNKK